MIVALDRRWMVLLLVALPIACSDSEGRDDDDASMIRTDSAVGVDAGPLTDSSMRDTGGDPADTGVDPADTSTDPPDATTTVDAGPAIMLCPGYVPPGAGVSTCRTMDDCAGRGICFTPGESTGCGPPPIHECVTDADCAGDGVERVCVEVGPCGGTSCVPVCTSPGASCDADETCNADNGRCEPISCEDGWVCPASAACSRGLGTPDEHGCARRDCTVDSDCDCGACVRGFCHDGPGFCGFPAP